MKKYRMVCKNNFLKKITKNIYTTQSIAWPIVKKIIYIIKYIYMLKITNSRFITYYECDLEN